MEGWIVIVLIAVALFAGFVIYDKRKFFAEKIKKLSFPKIPKKEKTVKEKPVKEKIKKVKPVKQKKKKNQKMKKKKSKKKYLIMIRL